MAVRSSRRELEIVGAIAEALNSAPTVQRALDRTLELVTDLLGLQTGWVWLVDPETDHIYSAAARNLPPYLQEPVRMTGSWCLCIEGFRNGSPAPRGVSGGGTKRRCRLRARPATRPAGRSPISAPAPWQASRWRRRWQRSFANSRPNREFASPSSRAATARWRSPLKPSSIASPS